MQFIKSTTVHDLIFFVCLFLIICGIWTCQETYQSQWPTQEEWNQKQKQIEAGKEWIRPPYHRDSPQEPVKVPSFDERQADALENIGAELKTIRLLLENNKIPAN